MRFFDLLESVNVTVADYDSSRNVHNLDDISNWLKTQLIYPVLNKMPEEQQKLINRETIVPDGDYYSGKNQIINFYTAGWPQGMAEKTVKGIKYFLDSRGIKYGPFKVERSGMFSSEVVRIPILQFNSPRDAPPQLNLSNDNAYLIFHDILEIYTDVISAVDLYNAIENLDEDKLDSHVRKPEHDKQWHDFGLSAEAIRQRLEKIKLIAKWAIDHNFDTIEVS